MIMKHNDEIDTTGKEIYAEQRSHKDKRAQRFEAKGSKKHSRDNAYDDDDDRGWN
jgi:hypothetical protein